LRKWTVSEAVDRFLRNHGETEHGGSIVRSPNS
jgi:hypothetical protein